MDVTTNKIFSLEVNDNSFDKFNEDFFAINTALDRLEETLNLHHKSFKATLSHLKSDEEMLYREAMETIKRLKVNHDVKELCNFNELHPCGGNSAFWNGGHYYDLYTKPFCPLGGDSAFWNEYRYEHCDDGEL